MKGHVGVYIGNGKGIECTTAWGNNVQVTAVSNIGFVNGLNHRRWTGHGKLPFITYGEAGGSNSNENEPVDISNYPMLRKGSRGEYVKILQRLLQAKGYDPKGVDGIFGKNTLAAVVNFQEKNSDIKGKPLAVDGIVGPLTWGALVK